MRQTRTTVAVWMVFAIVVGCAYIYLTTANHLPPTPQRHVPQ